MVERSEIFHLKERGPNPPSVGMRECVKIFTGCNENNMQVVLSSWTQINSFANRTKFLPFPVKVAFVNSKLQSDI